MFYHIPTNITTLFPGWNCRSQVFHNFSIICRSFCNIFMSATSVIYQKLLVSSASSIQGQTSVSCRSFMYNTKSSGSRKLLCGTPLYKYLLWVVWLHLVPSQAITGCPPSQAISMIQAVIESWQTRRIRHCR